MSIAPWCSAASNLTQASSALLRKQADSPVNWLPWGEEAFARAQREQKPVFLAVGVFTSELTRAMSRQSFSNADSAALLNENFVCVYVDAKERPDVAALCQNYLQNVKQLSGPPMNLWLTPEFKPFDGANYLPPTEEWGKEGFVTASRRVATAWKGDANAQRRKADDALNTLASAQPEPAATAPAEEELARLLAAAAALWRERVDATNGGFGDPPKHPEPELLRFLLASEATRDMALATLQALINGALRDPLDGGFFRYAVDPQWRQPYFQKLLIDQPRIAIALLEAARVTGDTRYAAAARGALEFALTQLALPGGDFAAAEDATAEAATAAYCWTADELTKLLGADTAAEFNRIHGVTVAGNIAEDAFPGVDTKGRNILFRAVPLPEGGPEDFVVKAIAKLRPERQQRAAAERDDGSTSGAHGLMLTALARAAADFKDDRFARAAKAEFGFIRDKLRAKDGSLLRLAGRTALAAPSDYALVIEGLLTFSANSGGSAAEKLAFELLRDLNARYWDSRNGRCFVSPADAPGFWARGHSPTPGAGDPPSAEPALLAALASARNRDKVAGEIVPQLIATVANEIKNAGEAPRGDLLLALQRSR